MPSCFRDHPVEVRLDLALDERVDLGGLRAETALGEWLDDPLERRRRACGNDDVCPLLGERLRDRAPEGAAAAVDDCGPAVQQHIRSSPRPSAGDDSRAILPRDVRTPAPLKTAVL
jgi:hypothetical protein